MCAKRLRAFGPIIIARKKIQGEDFSCSQFVAAFLGQEKDHQKVWKEIGELESLLARKKQEIKEKGR